MITVPSQEIAAFLGNHLDHVLQRTGNNFLSSVAADREFRAGCAIMDVLNAVESVQASLRMLLEKNGARGRPSENPFLCLFVDIYNLASQDENLKSERFVTSVILNGKGEELAPKTPSELIALAQKVESKPVNLGLLEEFLPEVPVEEQVKVGLGWDSQQTRDEKKRVWEVLTAGSRHGDENDPCPITHPVSPVAPFLAVNGVKESHGHLEVAPVAPPTPPSPQPSSQPQPQKIEEAEEEEEEELEEWEIEAERRFQDSDVDDAPALPAPKKPTTPVKTKAVVTETVAPKKPSPILEQAAAAAAAGDQDQVKRRRKMWPRK
ncbi:hypothetical protein BGZ70_009122 [Mortierella alpina]|uniref:Uncharacterized protein n=1 Tax=Mortierella alpina TaxID=64518 RepID=A0A9P6J2I5_MORAP|nr:hypothetical protein BGZ70_009122 [Mortierella alpina]